MQAGRVALVTLAAGVGLAALVATGCNSAWNSPDPPGEWADAAASGSGYGTGLTRHAHVFGERMPLQGPGPVENTRELALKKLAAEADAAAAPDAGAAGSRSARGRRAD